MAVEPLWLTTDEVEAIHENQLELHGGLPGVKDLGLVESALHVPVNKFHYEGEADVLILALTLCLAIAKNHGFSDGNKRTATVAMLLFLEINGFELIIPEGEEDPDRPYLGARIESLVILGPSFIPTLYAAFLPYLHSL